MTQPDKDHDDGSDTETDRVQAMVHGGQGPPTAQLFEREPVWARDFTDLSYEWRHCATSPSHRTCCSHSRRT